MTHKYDLIVIGSGPAGQRSALQAAKAGKKVAIIEDYPDVGGGCVHFGTLPSKSFRESVYRWSMGSKGALGQAIDEIDVTEQAAKGTQAAPPSALPDMKRLLRRKDWVVRNEASVVKHQLKRNKIEIFHGRGVLVGPHEVEIHSEQGQEKITGEFIFIATGSRPVAPPHIHVDGKRILDSNNVLDLDRLPNSMIILGAGIIGAEYASMFSMAGTHVTMIDRRDKILGSVDQEIAQHLMDRFSDQGMKLYLESDVKKVTVQKNKKGEERVNVELSNGNSLEADVVLVALGRNGNTDGLGLETVGLQADERGLLKVNRYYQTEVKNIYAIGDVVGAPALASTSMEQGRIACCHALDLETGECGLPGGVHPYGIYTIPELSMIGETEEQLKERGVEYISGRAFYRELARGQIVGDQWGMLKLLVDHKTQKLLGVHIVGDSAADLIHIGQAVMDLNGDVFYFVRTVFNYPTLAEAYKTAAFNIYNQLQKSQ
jgi:NAD(P) transhydrogenase